MALNPFLFSDALDDLVRLRRLTDNTLDRKFGLGALNDDFLHMSVPLWAGYVRPWRHQATSQSGVSNIQNNKDGFKVNLDVQQFKPEEVQVKMVDNFIVVEGKHEERQDEHGFISRQFQRKYKLPEDVDLDSVSSKLSSDGVLTIEALKKASAPPQERVLNITHTNDPAITDKNAGNSDKDAGNGHKNTGDGDKMEL